MIMRETDRSFFGSHRVAAISLDRWQFCGLVGASIFLLAGLVAVWTRLCPGGGERSDLTPTALALPTSVKE